MVHQVGFIYKIIQGRSSTKHNIKQNQFIQTLVPNSLHDVLKDINAY